MALSEIDVNNHLSNILIAHDLSVVNNDDFLWVESIGLKIKSKVFYQEVNGYVSSQLDVVAIVSDGRQIIESFGDYGVDLNETLARNFQNFSANTLHVLFAAFGIKAKDTLEYINIEEWYVNGKTWIAYIGNISCKAIGSIESAELQTTQFFDVFENAIKSQDLNNDLYWFRGFYTQNNEDITLSEFLMDNDSIDNADRLFNTIPVIPNIDFFSCRIFAVLQQKL